MEKLGQKGNYKLSKSSEEACSSILGWDLYFLEVNVKDIDDL